MAFLLPVFGAIGSGLSTAAGALTGAGAAAGAAAGAGGLGFGSVMGGLGTAVSVAGSLLQGQAASAAADYNAKLMDVQSKTAQDQAASKAGQNERQLQQRMAAARATAGQNGLDPDSGSTLAVLNSAEDSGHLDTLTAIYEGKVAATGYQNSASLSRMQSGNASAGGFLSGAARLLTGFGRQFSNTSPLALAS